MSFRRNIIKLQLVVSCCGEEPQRLPSFSASPVNRAHLPTGPYNYIGHKDFVHFSIAQISALIKSIQCLARLHIYSLIGSLGFLFLSFPFSFPRQTFPHLGLGTDPPNLDGLVGTMHGKVIGIWMKR